MKISYLSDSRVPSSGADSVHVMRMCNAMAEHGHEVELFCYKNDEDVDPFAQYGLAPTFLLNWYREIPLRGLRRLARIWYVLQARRATHQPDLYYGRDAYGLAVAAGCGVPVIFEAHAPPLSRLQHECINWLIRRDNFRRLIVISNPLRKEYFRLFPNLNADQVIVAHDASDSMEPDPSINLPSWPGREGVCQLGYVGSLYRGKGAEVVAELAHRMPHYDFHIVGDYPEGRARLQPAATNLHFHGRVEHRAVPSYLARFDVLLFPGQDKVIMRDGWDIGRWTSPMKLFEYMAAGKCIVASDTHATRDLIENEVSALIVPPVDLGAWQQAVARLANDQNLQRTLACGAYSRWQEAHTWLQRAGTVLRGLDQEHAR